MAYYGYNYGYGYGYGYSGQKRRVDHTWPAATAQPAPKLEPETPIYPVSVNMVGTVTTIESHRRHGFSGNALRRDVYIVNTSRDAWLGGLENAFQSTCYLPPSSIVRACCVFTSDWHFGPGPTQAFKMSREIRTGDVISVSGVVAAPFKPKKEPHGSALIQITVLSMEIVRGLYPIEQMATKLAMALYDKCKANGVDIEDVENVHLLRGAAHEVPALARDANPLPLEARRMAEQAAAARTQARAKDLLRRAELVLQARTANENDDEDGDNGNEVEGDEEQDEGDEERDEGEEQSDDGDEERGEGEEEWDESEDGDEA